MGRVPYKKGPPDDIFLNLSLVDSIRLRVVNFVLEWPLSRDQQFNHFLEMMLENIRLGLLR